MEKYVLSRLVSFRYSFEDLAALDMVVSRMQVDNLATWSLREVNRTTVLKRLVEKELIRMEEEDRRIAEKLESTKKEAKLLLRELEEKYKPPIPITDQEDAELSKRKPKRKPKRKAKLK